MFDASWPVLFALVFMIWRALHVHLNRKAQPLRLALAERGETLLAKHDLAPETRKDIEFMMGSAFSRSGLMGFAIFAVPPVILYLLLNPKKRALTQRDYGNLDMEERRLWDEIRSLHSRLLLVNHPLLTSICLLEVAILMPAAQLISMIFERQSSTPSVDRYAFISIIETQEQSLLGHFRRKPAPAHCRV